MKFRFQRPACGDMSFLLEREWLECNGQGGYASSTLACCNTRKYHGLVVANLPQPISGRHVLISALHDSVRVDGQQVALSYSQFEKSPLPEGFANLREVTVHHWPAWEFEVGGARVRKELLMPGDRDVVLIRYELLEGAPAAKLALKPLIAYRRNHHVGRKNKFMATEVAQTTGGIRMTPYKGLPECFVTVTNGHSLNVEAIGEWYIDFLYRQEKDRGYPAIEDLFVPALLSVTMVTGEPVYVVAGTEQVADPGQVWKQTVAERKRQAHHRRGVARARAGDRAMVTLLDQFLQAGEQFRILAPPERPTILAGYHWFEDWGRDTMIALPGLTFARGDLEEGFAILNTFVQHARDGRIPNYIGPQGATPTYNSVDATLWMFWAIQQYLFFGGNKDRVWTELWSFLKEAVWHYAEGRHDDAYMTDGGLLHCGSQASQLTWMDAAVNGNPVTPRWGYAVELNALWFNALCLCEELQQEFGDSGYSSPIDTTELAALFRRTFWLEDTGYLADVVNEHGVDNSLRPNQIFAASVHHSPLDQDMARRVVAAVRRKLQTPFGLRTLSPDADSYRGQCSGDQETRDQAYHQGTVWPWLLGAFGEAYLKVNGNSDSARQDVADWMKEWVSHLESSGVGTVSEIFDGDPPYAARGCIAQAWSVAELSRLLILLRKDVS